MRSRRLGKGRPNASCSPTFQPAPTPRMKRPPLSSSSCAAIRASSEGWRNVIEATSGPKRMRSLSSAATTKEMNVSSASRSRGPVSEKKWSERQSDSKPASSVARTMRRHSSQPSPSCPSIITPRSIAVLRAVPTARRRYSLAARAFRASTSRYSCSSPSQM